MGVNCSMVQNIVIEKNVSRYNLLFGVYTDVYYETTKCFFVWLSRGNSGPSFSWKKGDRIDINYAVSKANDLNEADMTSIMSGIKENFPTTISEIVVPDCYKHYL